MTLNDLKAQLDALPAAERDKLLDDLVAAYEIEATQIESEEDFAEELRQTQSPSMYDAGRFKVAANPLEHLASTAAQLRGDIMGHQARSKYADLAGRQQSATRAIQNAMLANTRGASPAASQMMQAQALRRMGSGR